jgi:WD40 repeat protein
LINLWDVKTGQIVKTLNGHAESVTGVTFSPDGQHLASASQDQTAKVWDVPAGKELFTMPGHTGGLTSIAFSPDGLAGYGQCRSHR